MDKNPDLLSVLASALTDCESGWNIGSMGAIAEFHQSRGEDLLIDDTANLTRATQRGAIRLSLTARAVPLAYETVSQHPRRWVQGIAICLPISDAGVERHAVVTEIGADAQAIRQEDKPGILFDLGLDQPQMAFCIRISDPGLTRLVRENCGRTIWQSGNPVMPAVLEAHPHRVAISALGRIEVYQKIGGRETGGKSPQGPHTHLLPKLLQSGRTHSATTPIAQGFLPCASLHPANPVLDPLGRPRAFRPEMFHHFQKLLKAWGPAEYVDVKHAVWDDVKAGLEPGTFREPASRLGRAALKNALRQMARIAEHDKDAALARTAGLWRAAFDPRSTDGEPDHDISGH